MTGMGALREWNPARAVLTEYVRKLGSASLVYDSRRVVR
jgi:hypothetical protein